MIAKDKVVSLNYRLFEDSAKGNKVEETYGGEPLTFIYGNGMMIPKFEEYIANLKAEDKFSFTLLPTEAYGEITAEAVVDVNKSIFEVDGKVDAELLKLGNAIPMKDSNGGRLDGIVKEVTEDKVKMDFNHPMAGKTLYFEGDVVEVRDATAEELSQGPQGAGEHHHHDEDHECTGCGKHNH